MPHPKKNCAKSLLSICYSTEMKLFIDVQFKARRKTSKLPAFGQGMFLNELQIELVTSLILYWHLASCWRPTTNFIDGLRMTTHWKKLWAESTLFAFSSYMIVKTECLICSLISAPLPKPFLKLPLFADGTSSPQMKETAIVCSLSV